MARKHSKSISFYLSDEDYDAIKNAASSRQMTLKDYLIAAHRTLEGTSETGNIEQKLDAILDILQSSPRSPVAVSSTPVVGNKFQEFLDELRTERQRRNSKVIYELVKDSQGRGISLMQARESTSSTAKKNLEAMVEAGILVNRGKRYYLP